MKRLLLPAQVPMVMANGVEEKEEKEEKEEQEDSDWVVLSLQDWCETQFANPCHNLNPTCCVFPSAI